MIRDVYFGNITDFFMKFHNVIPKHRDFSYDGGILIRLKFIGTFNFVDNVKDKCQLPTILIKL